MGIQVGKNEIKLLPSADDMIVYTESPKESTQNLELICVLSKATGYELDTQNPAVFLCTSNECKATNFKIPFKSTQKIWSTWV